MGGYKRAEDETFEIKLFFILFNFLNLKFSFSQFNYLHGSKDDFSRGGQKGCL